MSDVTCLHVPYKVEFEPLVLIGENVAIAKSLDESKWEYYKVKYIEPFFIDYTSGTITNGSTLENVKIDDMKLQDNEVGQVRVLVQNDGFLIGVKLPSATSKYTTKETATTFDKWVSDNYPHLTEMFYMSDTIPVFSITNNSGADGSCELRIVGFRYVLEKLPMKPSKYTVIYVETVASQG